MIFSHRDFCIYEKDAKKLKSKTKKPSVLTKTVQNSLELSYMCRLNSKLYDKEKSKNENNSMKGHDRGWIEK